MTIILPSRRKELKAKMSINAFLPARDHQLFILHQRQENRYLKKKKKQLSKLIYKKHPNVSYQFNSMEYVAWNA